MRDITDISTRHRFAFGIDTITLTMRQIVEHEGFVRAALRWQRRRDRELHAANRNLHPVPDLMNHDETTRAASRMPHRLPQMTPKETP